MRWTTRMAMTVGLLLVGAAGCRVEPRVEEIHRADDRSRRDGLLTGGTEVVVRGAHLTHDAVITIGGKPLVDKKVKGTTRIVGRTPPGDRVGVVKVAMRSRNGNDELRQGWEYTPGDVRIDEVLPNVGDVVGGTQVTVMGGGFVPGTIVEFIDPQALPPGVFGVLGDVTVVDLGTIAGRTPPGVPDLVADVRVTNAFGTATLERAFSYLGCADPTLPVVVDLISPALGPVDGGTTVTISGTGLDPGSAVEFGGVPGMNIAYAGAPCSITVETPPAADPGPVDVVVQGPRGTCTVEAGFRYTSLGIASLEPDRGPLSGGTRVTVTGTGFEDPSTFLFGKREGLDGTFVSPETYTVVTPPGNALGLVDVVVRNGNGSAGLVDGFEYLPVTIESIEPNFSPLSGGITVVIHGTGLENMSAVRIGLNDMLNLVVSGDGTQIRGTAPPGNAPGTADVVIETASLGEVILSDGFLYDPGPPRIGRIIPNYGPLGGGETVKILGENFTNAPFLVSITFDAGAGGEDGIPGRLPVDPSTIVVHSPRVLTAVVPAKPDGVLEIVEVEMASPLGATSVPNLYSYAQWQGPGPIGGFATAIQIDPRDSSVITVGLSGLGLGSTGGLYRSTDGGASWVRREEGLTDTNINALALAPSGPDTLYAGTPSGLLRTADGGLTWVAAENLPFSDRSLSGLPILSVVVDPVDSDVLVVGSDGSRVMRSLDGGATTAAAALLGPSSVDVTALAASPGGAIFAGTGGEGVFRSGDGGVTWTPRNVDLSNRFVLGLAADPFDPDRIYAGTLGSGVFVLDPAADRWTASGGLPGAPTPAVYGLAADPTRAGRVYAAVDDVGGLNSGIWVTDDAGGTWFERSAGLEDSGIDAEMRSVVVDPTNGLVALAGALAGVYRTTDGALLWRRADTGISNTNVRSIVRAATGQTFAGTFGGGVYRSLDGGLSWTPSNGVAPRSVTATRVQALTLGQGSGVLYAGTSDGGVFMSADLGATWSEENGGLSAHPDPRMSRNVTTIAVTPGRENEVWMGTEEAGLWGTDSGGTPGLMWTRRVGDPLLGLLSEDRIREVVVSEEIVRYRDPQADPQQIPYPFQVILIGTNGEGVFTSDDRMASCTRDGVGGLGRSDVRSLHVGVGRIPDPQAPWRWADNLYVYAGTGGLGVLRGRASIEIVPDVAAPGLFVAQLQGITWQDRNAGLENLSVTAVTVDPTAPWNVFLGTEGGGVYVSGNDAVTWQLLDPGSTLTNPQVADLGLVLDPCALCTTVLAGTAGGGIQRLRFLEQP